MAKASARRASDNKLERLQAFVDELARQGMVDLSHLHEATVRAWLARLVEKSQALATKAEARPDAELRVSGRLVGPVIIDHQDADGFVFITKEPALAPCRACGGDGEITDYPPDDDERMVACTACGGTGEAVQL